MILQVPAISENFHRNFAKNVADLRRYRQKNGGLFLMEHPKREPRQMPDLLDGLVLRQTRKYGKSSLSIFESVHKDD